MIFLAVNYDLFLVIHQLADDDDLVDHITREAVGALEVDDVECISPDRFAERVEGGTVEICAAVTVFDELFGEDLSGGGYLPLEFCDLTFYRPFFSLLI